MSTVTATQALLAVSALHAGFQLVVSVVVYPTLAESLSLAVGVAVSGQTLAAGTTALVAAA